MYQVFYAYYADASPHMHLVYCGSDDHVVMGLLSPENIQRLSSSQSFTSFIHVYKDGERIGNQQIGGVLTDSQF
jgi:hypothetical protein